MYICFSLWQNGIAFNNHYYLNNARISNSKSIQATMQPLPQQTLAIIKQISGSVILCIMYIKF